jgi:Helix-turn-helix domain
MSPNAVLRSWQASGGDGGYLDSWPPSGWVAALATQRPKNVPRIASSSSATQPISPPSGGVEVGLVRGVLAERVVISTALDPFLSLVALSEYSGLSVRKLRDHLSDPVHPLPHYRVGGKVLVRRSEFDAWLAGYRRVGQHDVTKIVDDVLSSL